MTHAPRRSAITASACGDRLKKGNTRDREGEGNLAADACALPSVRRPPPPVGWFRQWSRFRGSVPGERAAPRVRLERLRGFEGAPRDAAPPSFRPPAPACSLSPRQLALLAAFPPAKPESLASPGALAPGV
ncbi:hypothetical protein J1605_018417 [Eschrichtius robustus]|uniref:Uncharacterized protein n=1 Tax=Eschrichtius robustus TaxID=9764 RepID=A0AB34HUE6_ESCRO|nr:hypothetical protein J1605_018417 [Eschrichtius robustus]